MADQEPVTRANLLARMQRGWDELQAYLRSLSEEQLTGPTDAVGWTIKDHIMHLAIWEDGIWALLNRQSRREQMGIDQKTWESEGFDEINAALKARYVDVPLDAVLTTFREVHERLVERIQSLSDEDLLRPYRDYDAGSTSDRPVAASIVGNSFGHYAEHMPWMAAIVGG